MQMKERNYIKFQGGGRRIYLLEFNLMMGNAIYLPIATSLLKMYALKNDMIRQCYQFMPYIFQKSGLADTLAEIEEPSVAAFSVSMWNYNLSLQVAEKIKKHWPDCLIVMGGPSIPFNAEEFFTAHPWVDVTVRGEGERTFSEVLLEFSQGENFSAIKGISYRDQQGLCVKNEAEQVVIADLSEIPSPYLAGEFTDLLQDRTVVNYQAIIETNRGCPFNCGYCFWGMGGLSTKMRLMPQEMIKNLAEWIAANKIEYVFCADSNFGMFPRDVEIAQCFADVKRKFGFPEKFRVCFAKNAEDRVFSIGSIFASSALSKSTTLSLQSKNEIALKNIGRDNISLDVFKRLHQRCAEKNIPVYTEFILGLPGETYRSFLDGLRSVLCNQLYNEIFIYLCQVYPNTAIADHAFRKKHGIRTIQIPLHEIHCTKNAENMVLEFEQIIAATNSMTTAELIKLTVISTLMQCFMSLKLLYYPLLHLEKEYQLDVIDFIEDLADQLQQGGQAAAMHNNVLRILNCHAVYAENLFVKQQGRGIYDERYGRIYWEIEEFSFLEILLCDRASFIDDVMEILTIYLNSRHKDYDVVRLSDCVRYQAAMLPEFQFQQAWELNLEYDFVEYFSQIRDSDGAGLKQRALTLEVTSDLGGINSLAEFAKRVVLYGRKGGGLAKVTRIHSK